MPVTMEGTCRCGAVEFSVRSHTPHPYQLCYCSICRKQDGGGGYAINLGALSETLEVAGRDAIGLYRARIAGDGGACHVSTGERNFCTRCATALWLYDPTWPDLVHPFASAIDSELPVPPSRVHLMLDFKASWVVPDIGTDDRCFDRYPEQSIADWHKTRGLWVD
ncbi:MAG: GFA family protein [Flavobacteriaceae bacterium]